MDPRGSVLYICRSEVLSLSSDLKLMLSSCGAAPDFFNPVLDGFIFP